MVCVSNSDLSRGDRLIPQFLLQHSCNLDTVDGSTVAKLSHEIHQERTRIIVSVNIGKQPVAKAAPYVHLESLQTVVENTRREISTICNVSLQRITRKRCLDSIDRVTVL